MADTLRELTAGELRAELARHRVSAVELARRLGWSQSYMARRVDGRVALDMDDLEAVARALDVAVSDLLPRKVAERLNANTHRYPASTGQPMPSDARRTHPIGRPVPPQRSSQRTVLTTKPERTVPTKPYTANPARL